MKFFGMGHEVGHVVFKNWRLVQKIFWDFFQGWPSSWWKFRHYQHHAKPNVVRIIMTDHNRINCDNNFVF